MCDPVSITVAAVSIAGIAYQHEQGVKATNAAIDAEAEAQRQRAADAALAQNMVLQDSAEQQSQRSAELQRELSFLEASAAEYGGGRSSDRLASLANAAGARDLNTIATNRDRELTQLSRANEADIMNTRNRLRSIRANAPSRTGTLLKIGAAGADAYAGYKARQAAAKPTKSS